MGKIHLAYSDEPLISGNDQATVCGKVISKAVFPFIFDGEFTDAAHLNSLRICAMCYAVSCHTFKYMYGLVSGQEAMTEVA